MCIRDRFDTTSPAASRRTLSIVGRAISTMIEWGAFNDVVRTYYQLQDDGVDFNLAFIDSDFPATVHEDFDPAYMRSLYDYGYQRARRGYEWSKAPPFIARPGPQRRGPLAPGIF